MFIVAYITLKWKISIKLWHIRHTKIKLYRCFWQCKRNERKKKARKKKSEKVTFKIGKAFFQPIWDLPMIVSPMYAF